MRWLARQSFMRIVVLALLWPLLLAVVAAGVATALALRSGEDDVYFVLATGPGVATLIVGPPVALFILWGIARKRRGSATSRIPS